jgi:hypothetical protein
MFDRALLGREFGIAMPYDRYVAGGKPEQRAAWQKIYDQARLRTQHRVAD